MYVMGIYQIYLIVICENILEITIIWQNEPFKGKEQKAKHIIFVDLFHSNAGKSSNVCVILVNLKT